LEHGAALTSRLQSFEAELLTQAENLAGLVALNRELVARAEPTIRPPKSAPTVRKAGLTVLGCAT